MISDSIDKAIERVQATKLPHKVLARPCILDNEITWPEHNERVVRKDTRPEENEIEIATVEHYFNGISGKDAFRILFKRHASTSMLLLG